MINYSFGYRLTAVCLCLFCFFQKTQAQTEGIGSWNIINLKYTLSPQWSVFGEAQLRSLRFYSFFHYHEYKFGVDWKVNSALKLTLGAGDYDTYGEAGSFVTPKNNDEFRLWPQLILNQSLGKFKIEQRYRAEFRFTSNGYRNRFRYRLGLSYPLGRETAGGFQPFQISGSNELFFTNREPFFERNRVQISLQWNISKASAFQIGYLHQFDYQINDEIGRDFLVVGISHELFAKTKGDGSMD